MIKRKFFKGVATTVAITGTVFTGIIDIAGAVALKNGDVDGLIRNNSPSFRFKNESRSGTPQQRAIGEEYTFNAQQGDSIQASVEVADGSSLSPILVLISSQTGQQVAYEDTDDSLEYQVPTTGAYRLLVLGQNNTRGRYTLSVSGLAEGTQVSQSDADQVMKNVLQLRTVGCGVPNVARITIGSEERCTRDVEAGQYTYEESSRSIKLASASGQTTTDDRRKLLQDEYGLRVLDSCPNNRSSVAVVSFPNSSQTSTYCATPNRVIPAGQYTYNASTGDLDPEKKPQQCNVTVGGVCLVK